MHSSSCIQFEPNIIIKTQNMQYQINYEFKKKV